MGDSRAVVEGTIRTGRNEGEMWRANGVVPFEAQLGWGRLG